ncbi:MAG: AhpC/TSA family protein [Bacteroidetes bacterium]|nr:AhpC/TSA family protein [Bacteroidota bacterium]
MRRLMIPALSALVLMSCEQASDTYKLEGEALGYADDTKILVYTFENNQSKIIDTLIVQNEKFSSNYLKQNEPSLNFLRIQNENLNLIYFPENQDLKATIYKDSLHASYVKGSRQNDNYTEYRKKTMELAQRNQQLVQESQQAMQQGNAGKITELQSVQMNLQNEQKMLQQNFIENNKNSLFSLMLLGEMLNQNSLTSKQASDYLNSLEPKVSNHFMAKEVKNALERMSIGEIGSKAPDFSGPTPDGGEMSLQDALGKYTIIDFWASWCMPCRVENPNVVSAYRKYHEKGLNIISVSLDRPGGRNAWINAIEKDEMDWYHISNLQFWNDPIAKKYGVRSIPATFLLDENGIIIDKNLRGQALHAKLATLFD